MLNYANKQMDAFSSISRYFVKSWHAVICRESVCIMSHRPVIPAGAGGAMAPPDFGRSVNPISTRRGRLCPLHYYWHPGIFRPSY